MKGLTRRWLPIGLVLSLALVACNSGIVITPPAPAAPPSASTPPPTPPTPPSPSPAPPSPPSPPTPPPAPAPLCPETMVSGQGFECQLPSGGVAHTLENAPVGMRVQPRSGLIHWTPTLEQVGRYTVGVSGGRQFNLTVTAGAADPSGIYVAPNGNDSGAGTATSPYQTLQKAVDAVTPGSTVYLRGGVYRNADFGQPFGPGRKSNGIARITVSGTEQQPITLRSYGNEWAQLETDQNGVALSGVQYWTVEGLEVSGLAQSLTLEDAMQIWWADDNSRIDGRGIISNSSQHINIRNNVVHDFPGAGINDTTSDFITIQDNLIYNNAWWSTSGVQGAANSGLLTTDPSTSNLEKIVLRGNLVFGNQSLLISHVFSKGYVTLTIDEGNGLHLQNNQKTYQGKALVENNLMLYNGKAGLGLNTMDGVRVRNNSFYQNARVGSGTGDLILQSSTASAVENNLFAPRPDRRTIRDFSNAYTNVLANATQATSLDTNLPASVLRLGQIFQNPQLLDFRPAAVVPGGMGVPETELSRMFAQAAQYGIEIAAPMQIVDDNYLLTMKQRIFSTWPASQNALKLEDKATGFTYTYDQRCQYPNPPSSTVCP